MTGADGSHQPLKKKSEAYTISAIANLVSSCTSIPYATQRTSSVAHAADECVVSCLGAAKASDGKYPKLVLALKYRGELPALAVLLEALAFHVQDPAVCARDNNLLQNPALSDGRRASLGGGVLTPALPLSGGEGNIRTILGTEVLANSGHVVRGVSHLMRGYLHREHLQLGGLELLNYLASAGDGTWSSGVFVAVGVVRMTSPPFRNQNSGQE